MDNLKFGDCDLTFKLKRLVFVNSANHAYSEIMLDKPMVLFGSNNAGKTASLAATKLLLFPENNFQRCEHKFKFEGKNGNYYSAEESYSFYFPIAKSFLALEVESNNETFCMVLFAPSSATGVKYTSYHRVFIPVAYEEIRSIFWDEANNDFSENLGVDALIQATKRLGGKEVSEPKRLVEMMYNSLGNEDSKYCIMPLKDSGSESITAFRNIYNLAFSGSKTETDVLPSAIAALIEMQRGREAEKLSITLQDVYDQYKDLMKRSQHLDLLDSNESNFSNLKSKFESLKCRIQEYSVQYHRSTNWLTKQMDNLAPQIKIINDQYANARDNVKKLKDELKDLNDQNNRIQGELNGKVRDLAECEATLGKCASIFNEYPADHHNNATLVIELLSEAMKEEKQKLVDSQDAVSASNSLQGHYKTIALKKNQIELIKGQIENQSLLIVNQIDSHSSQVLHLLNNKLTSISCQLSPSEIETIQSFTSLFQFNQQNRGVFFKDYQLSQLSYLPYSSEDVVNQLQQQLIKLGNELEDLMTEIRRLELLLNNKDNVEFTESEKRKLEKAIFKLDTDIELMKQQSSLEIRIQQVQEQKQILEENVQKLSEEFNKKKEVYELASGEEDNLCSTCTQLSGLKDKYEEIQKLLNFAKNQFEPIFKERLDQIEDDAIDATLTVDQAKALSKKIADESNAIYRLNLAFKSDFDKFAALVPDDRVQTHINQPTLDELAVNIITYSNIFANLKYQRNQLNNDIRSHNEEIRAQSDEIKQAGHQLRRHIEMFNTKLNGHRISNLSAVKLHMEPAADFILLESSLNKFNVSSDALTNEKFYLMLLNFFEKHKGANGRLKMVDLIKSISYQFMDGDKVMTKSQSGGTTSTVTAFVLSVLLKEIKQADTVVHIPIVVDEISTLDALNSRATIQQISEQGFSIFCATPEFNTHIAQTVGQYIFIDMHRTSKTMLPTCNLHVMPHHIDSFGEYDEA